MPKGIECDDRRQAHVAIGLAALILTATADRPASAQAQQKQESDSVRRSPGPISAAPRDFESGAGEIVVTGDRRSAIGGIEPLATFDANAVAASGATDMNEFLRSIRGVTQSSDGSEPIFLLNAQRVSGYQEIGTLPPEAIEKVEVLPEQAALKFGFPPTRRVVNFITKRNFRQVEARGSTGITTRGGSGTDKANLGLTRLRKDSRLTLALEYRHTDPLRQSDRDIAPDPDILFDSIGNVTAIGGGEIDPALSAAAGRIVAVVPVPASGSTGIAAFAAGADRPRLFDLGPYRRLVPRNDALKGEAVIADRIGATLAGSISLSAERSRDRGISGPATATLVVPGTNPFSPFSRTVLLQRYLTEAELLHQNQVTTNLHAGFTLRGAISGWRWDLSGGVDQQERSGSSERGIDLSAANGAIANGTNPFAPLAASLLSDRIVDQARLLTRTASVKTVVTNAPIRLPAGEVSVTATAEAERATARSRTRGPDPFDLALGRSRAEAGLSLDIPIASRKDDVLAWLGRLSLNASVNGREVSGFGTLHDTSLGFNWGPIEGVQLLGTIRRKATAPDMAKQSMPEVRITNVPVFDFGNGRTELVTLIQGGNPDLAAEVRVTRSLGITIKPFAKREWRVSATYEALTIRNQTGNVYAITPQTEAILPDLFTRDTAGRLVSVAYRPINFSLERQRQLNLTVNMYGMLGKPPPGPPPAGQPPARPTYYGGIGPTIKFADRLLIRSGAPVLDLLAGDTITGAGSARAFGYAYGGYNYLGNGFNFDAWYGGGNRVRSADPAGDLRFSPIFRLNLSAFLSVHHFLRQEKWTSKMQLKLDISNVTDMRQRVRDRDGRVPSRFQPDYIDPVGRTLTLSLRKLF